MGLFDGERNKIAQLVRMIRLKGLKVQGAHAVTVMALHAEDDGGADSGLNFVEASSKGAEKNQDASKKDAPAAKAAAKK